MNIKGQLKKLFTVISMSGLIYSATVELVPSTLPVGASDSSPFMQAITITLQNNGAGSWANNEEIYIYTPSEIGIADPDEDNSYTDGVSVSLLSAAALGVSVSAADAGSITLKFATGGAIANGDKFTVIFPVSTSGATDGQTANYSITYSAGDEEVGGEAVTATFEPSILEYVSWHAKYTGGDASSALGDVHPAAASAVLSSGLTDWVAELDDGGDCVCNSDDEDTAGNDESDYDDDQVACEAAAASDQGTGFCVYTAETVDGGDGDADEVVNGDDTDFEGITLNESEGGDEMVFSLWFSTSSDLTQVNAANATLVDNDNTAGVCTGADDDNDGGTAYSQPTTQALCLDPAGDDVSGDGADVAGTWTSSGTYSANESGTFAAIQFDHENVNNGAELIQGTLYFYITSNWTGAWALG